MKNSYHQKPTGAFKAIALGIIAVAGISCQTVQSSELKSTLAEDLELEATVQSYNDEGQVQIGAQMQTIGSQVGLTFDQGETLATYYDTDEGLSNLTYLSDAGWLNLDQDYEGTLKKVTGSRNYYITYSDADGTRTTATIPNGGVADLITPAEDAVISGSTYEVTWNPADVKAGGTLTVQYRWSYGSTSSYGYKTVDNSGSYDLDVSDMQGSGAIDLVNTFYITEAAGFGNANIRMQNISRRNVSFGGATPAVNTKSLPTDILKIDPLDDDFEIRPIQEKIDILQKRCARVCEANEGHFFTVGEETYSCCQ